MEYKELFMSVIFRAGCREEHEKKGENQNTKGENSRDRYRYMAQTYEKTVFRVRKKQYNLRSRMNYL